MRKNIIIITALVIGLAAAGPVFAKGRKGGMKDGGMMGKDKGMMEMHGMMGKASMVATGDGGVIVLKGNKLYKYDTDLNLVKEAELKADEMDMGAMKKMCPMCSKMTGKAEEGSVETPVAAKNGEDKSEHESHH
ncbi:MAG: hypothetical protein COW13_05455 [Candidatus Omnitrophica bacterium CG12_big_fil_rev_8_21_14_0_65_50_5]|nr:MAG: hypothetical protein COW13_05455 [Candidatus Omnitrophica bacterium CG12_big_fil_rev_8_21_14_0_65_50_5]